MCSVKLPVRNESELFRTITTTLLAVLYGVKSANQQALTPGKPDLTSLKSSFNERAMPKINYCPFPVVAIGITLILRCDNLLASEDHWPSGSYSLPKPKSGCPKFWKEGWLRQDVEDDAKSIKSEFSPNFHMDASLVEHGPGHIDRGFCTKFHNSFDTHKLIPWPKGSYCIYRINGFCPNDMVGGSILWDDEDNLNANHRKGYLPDLNVFYGNTQLYYCCQNKGKWYNSIQLPTRKPFYLLPYGSRNCQRVIGAVSSLEYIVYDTEDFLNADHFKGHHVFSDKKKSLPRIYYCYYKGCQYKLRNDNGSFGFPQSPFADIYPDFQICSWSITVNVSLGISLRFQTLHVPDCNHNSLDIYNGSEFLARFCGENATSGAKLISNANHLNIVLKSGDNSAKNEKDFPKHIRFYADYTAFLPAAKTAIPPTSMPSIFTKLSTLTKLPTVTNPAISSNQPSMTISGPLISTNRPLIFSEPQTANPPSFTNPTTENTQNSNKEKRIQNTSNEKSKVYVIVLAILAILLLLGVIAGILYCRRRRDKRNYNTDGHAQLEEKKQNKSDMQRYDGYTPPAASLKTTTNPSYDSHDNLAYGDDSGGNSTDNILYEPGIAGNTELFEWNPIYEGVGVEANDDNVDPIYAEPTK